MRKNQNCFRPLMLLLLALAGFALAPQKTAAQAGTETLTIIQGSCVAAAPCTLQLYKATLAAGATACPAAGASSYTALTTTQLGSVVGTVNTAWTYSDTALVVGVTYCYYATVTSTAGGAASPPSAVLTLAVPIPVPTLAPTLTGTFTAAAGVFQPAN